MNLCRLSVSMLMILPALTGRSYACTYYFSARFGDDNRSPSAAQHAVTPWRTLQKLSAIGRELRPGDSVLFRRGDSFGGSIIITCSGSEERPIFFGAYGKGSDPVIDGLATLSEWSTKKPSIWETKCRFGNRINVLLLDDRPRALGRYPNSDAPQKGYMTIKNAVGNNRLITAAMAGQPDFTSAELVVRRTRWILDSYRITRQSGDTIEYSPAAHSPAISGYGCFIQNDPAALDRPGEWFYREKEGRLGIFLPSGESPASRVQIAIIDTLVFIKDQSHLVIRDLSFRGANRSAFLLVRADDIVIHHCSILFSGVDAIAAYGCARLSVTGNFISFSGSNALYAEDCPYTRIENNTIRCTGTLAGMGEGNSGSYEAILHNGDHLWVEKNRIDSTGYIPVTFRGDSVVIRDNIISHFNMVKDDGGAIYTWNNPAHPPVYHYRQITGNIISAGIGAGDGTDDPGRPATHGIYIDDNAAGVTITGNTVSGCAGYGIFLHNAHEIVLTGNTCFNNKVQWVLAQDQVARGSPLNNITAAGNTFSASVQGQQVMEYKMSKTDSARLGSFPGNSYRHFR